MNGTETSTDGTSPENMPGVNRANRVWQMECREKETMSERVRIRPHAAPTPDIYSTTSSRIFCISALISPSAFCDASFPRMIIDL